MAGASSPLSDFLKDMARDEEVRRFVALSVEAARRDLQQRGLTPKQVDAVMSRDVSAIYRELSKAGETGPFRVPAGPVMDPDDRFYAFDSDPVPPVMDPFSEGKTSRGPARPRPAAAKNKTASKPTNAIRRPTVMKAKKAKKAKTAKRR